MKKISVFHLRQLTRDTELTFFVNITLAHINNMDIQDYVRVYPESLELMLREYDQNMAVSYYSYDDGRYYIGL